MRAVLEFLAAGRDLLLPPHCCGCGCGIPGGWWCGRCEKGLPWIKPPRCEACSQPFEGMIDRAFLCPNCQGRGFHFECAVAPARSRGPVRHLVHLLKYGRAAWAARPLAEFAARGFDDPRLATAPIDCIVPVPLHPLRQRERGYNQSALIAARLGRARTIAVREVLRRTRRTTTQTHFDRRQRMRNLRGAFALAPGRQVAGLHILLVDDVLTTGSTLDECARTLCDAGAESVRALTAARG